VVERLVHLRDPLIQHTENGSHLGCGAGMTPAPHLRSPSLPMRQIQTRRRPIQLVRAIALLFIMACSTQETDPASPLASGRSATAPEPVTPVARVVDSIVPPEVAMARFREGLTPTDTLSGGASSVAELTRRLIQALEDSDTTTMRSLVLDRAEFAYLYYPHTEYVAPPRAQPPALLWLFISQNSEKGAIRLVRRLSGRPLGYRGVKCPAPPRTEGPNSLWIGCTVEMGDGGGTAEHRLFGSIIERGGRFKFVSYTNDF